MEKGLYEVGKKQLIKDAKKWLGEMDNDLARNGQSLDYDKETIEGSAYHLLSRFVNLYGLKQI